LYLPQFFKENNQLVALCMRLMNEETVKQYQLEERSLMARRFRTARYRIACLLEVMINDSISSKEKIEQLREEAHRPLPAKRIHALPEHGRDHETKSRLTSRKSGEEYSLGAVELRRVVVVFQLAMGSWQWETEKLKQHILSSE
jgi:hypothetical protein